MCKFCINLYYARENAPLSAQMWCIFPRVIQFMYWWLNSFVCMLQYPCMRNTIASAEAIPMHVQYHCVSRMFGMSGTHVKTHKLLQVCKQVVTSLFTSCRQVVFALLVPSRCNKFGTSCYQLVTNLMALSDLLQVCSNKSDTVMM
jgi:hypothetical protein